MERILIVGATGSGKTTLGEVLAKRLGLDAIDLDALHWLPDWHERPTEESAALLIQRLEASQGRWVVMGNYTKLQHILWPKAQALVHLDYAFPQVLSQLLRRTIKRVIMREELFYEGSGIRETLTKTLSRDSILVWLLKSWHSRKLKLAQALAQPEHAHLSVIHLRSPDELRAWLDTLPTRVTP